MSRALSRFWPACLVLLASGPLSAADVRDMKLLEDEQGTRAVLEVQGLGQYKVFTLANPDRLVLDLEQARLAPGFDLPGPNGAVANVRAGKPVAGTLRIVLDLANAVTTRSRVEKEGAVTRLVVELSVPGRLVVARPPAPAPVARVIVDQPVAAIVAPVLPASAPAAEIAGSLQESSGLDRALLTPARPQPQLDPGTDESPISGLGKVAASELPPAQPHSQSPMPQPTPPRTATRTVKDVIGSGQRKLVVAIDAGHGGKDPGASGPSGVREKAVTLAVARELARQINADPGLRAVLIRDGDTFVPLKQRYMKARAAQADLFISIHADASPNDSASGASVFVLSTRGASSQAARWLADQENAADLVGGVSLDHKDPNLAAVLLDLSQSATMRASDDIANHVLGSLKNVGKAHKPAIERANFVVLRSPDVPSMLIETGFITNPSEEQRLNDAGYRTRLAQAIAGGIRKYFTDQAPVGSWYASLNGGADGASAPWVASSPE